MTCKHLFVNYHVNGKKFMLTWNEKNNKNKNKNKNKIKVNIIY